MLFDPRWEVKTELTSFIAWLETKDPQERYDYTSCSGECPVDQYLASIGKPHGSPANLEWWQNCENGKGLNHIAYPSSTFGELLQRARAAVES